MKVLLFLLLTKKIVAFVPGHALKQTEWFLLRSLIKIHNHPSLYSYKQLQNIFTAASKSITGIDAANPLNENNFFSPSSHGLRVIDRSSRF